MSYRLSAVTVRADNSPRGLEAIGRLWEDIQMGKIPLLFDNEGFFSRGSPLSPGTATMRAITPGPMT